jgi:hypothetical protein
MALLTCKCSATVRVPSLPTSRLRCGSCKHVFTIPELVKARPEPPPAKPEPGAFNLERQLDLQGEINSGKCPDCHGALRDDGYCVKCGEFWEANEEEDVE